MIETKKSQSKLVILLILSLIVLGLLLYFATTAFSDIDETNWVASCKVSIASYDLTNEIVCPTQNITLPKGEDKAKEEMAESLRTCWNIYGAGEDTLFNPKINAFCGLCYRVQIPEKISMQDYLYTHRVNKQYYSDYLGAAIDNLQIDDMKGTYAIIYIERKDSITDAQIIKELQVLPFDENVLKTAGCDKIEVRQK